MIVRAADGAVVRTVANQILNTYQTWLIRQA